MEIIPSAEVEAVEHGGAAGVVLLKGQAVTVMSSQIVHPLS